jgi:MtN3 and saliva related transmembrane protein
MNFVTFLGLLAATLTTLSFVPQVIKTWKTKSAQDFSVGMLIAFCLGVFLWLIYGIYISALPVILANAITLLLAGIILFFKVKFKS